MGDKITWGTSGRKSSHEHVFISSYQNGCEKPFNGTPPPPLFIIVPLALRFVVTRKRPNNVKGVGGGSYFYQGISKHRFLGKGLNNYVPDCR